MLSQIKEAMAVSTAQLEEDKQACLHDMQEVLAQKAHLQAALAQQQHIAQHLHVHPVLISHTV